MIKEKFGMPAAGYAGLAKRTFFARNGGSDA